MVKGLYGDGDSWVMVDYGRHRRSIPRDLYETRGYKPPCEELPTSFVLSRDAEPRSA
jgi:hypothetical protein